MDKMQMSIKEETKRALARLFDSQDQQTKRPETVVDDALDETDSGEQDAVRLPGVIEQPYQEKGFDLDVLLESDQLLPAVGIMFELGYFLESITGVDWIKEEQFEVVYDFSRYDFDRCRTVIRVRIPRLEPHLPTITGVYTGANWHERETHDFFGIVFDGHPHLIPLLLPEDADFHPLLKDFTA